MQKRARLCRFAQFGLFYDDAGLQPIDTSHCAEIDVFF